MTVKTRAADNRQNGGSKAMKRRDFVKSLAGTPVALLMPEFRSGRQTAPAEAEVRAESFHESTPPNAATKRVNVLVHGMFAIVVDRKGTKKVHLKAPLVGGTIPHRYHAQTFTVDPHDSSNLVKGWNADYEASVQTSSTVKFDRGPVSKLDLVLPDPQRLIVDVSSKKVGDQPFWSIELPVPDDIWPLRATPFNYLDSSPIINGSFNDTYVNNGMTFFQQLPIIYVLTYDKVPSDEKVTFSSGGFTQDVPFDAGVARLHVFAEPSAGTMKKKYLKQHLDDALGQLDKLFVPSLTLRFDPSLSEPDQPLQHDSNVDYPSVLLCEERSLDEREMSCMQFQNSETIESQYKAVLAYRAMLKELSERQSAERRKGLQSLTREDIKPPRNCMSLIATLS
jgi:hypothetical protein